MSREASTYPNSPPMYKVPGGIVLANPSPETITCIRDIVQMLFITTPHPQHRVQDHMLPPGQVQSLIPPWRCQGLPRDLGACEQCRHKPPLPLFAAHTCPLPRASTVRHANHLSHFHNRLLNKREKICTLAQNSFTGTTSFRSVKLNPAPSQQMSSGPSILHVHNR